MLPGQLVELVQQFAEREPADDMFAVRLGNAGLPHPEPAVADDHLRIRGPERLQPQHLVQLVADKPQRWPTRL
jgi:hypothetical protein